MDQTQQAELIIKQYQQWLADSQSQVAILASENILLKQQLADQAKEKA